MTNGTNDTLPPLSAETLPLYLPLWKDGALEADEARKVEDLARGNPEAEMILELLESTDQKLGTVFSETLEAPIPLRLARAARDLEAEMAAAPSAPHKSGWGRVVSLAAAASVALIVGLPAGYFVGSEQGRKAALSETQARFGWIAQIVGYHRLYSAEARHLVEVAASETGHIQTWIGARTGREFFVPNLNALGLEFRGARLLAVNGEPTAQLMYVPVAGGDPVGLCFLKTGNPDADFTPRTRDGFNMVTWRSGGYSFIAIGTSPAGTMEQVAKAASVSL